MANHIVVNYIVLIVSLVLALIAFIHWCVHGSFSVDSFFRMLFLVIACIFQGCAPFNWIPTIQENFKFMLQPIWGSSFMIVLACFFFPCFHDYCWDEWSWVIQNIASLTMLVIGIILLVLDIIGVCTRGGSSGSQSKSSTSTKTTTVVVTSNTLPK
ncbi:Hypothetical_protein [Hexamita inflata]|uniref:Hypothetical_protein n=1 Tax=Hexamita inflata TaxID=28002 RepID=A0AA86NFJ9_9EUKA|nr:Hypothetical protein HINF_LOCUS6399 [Hexamita inflata]